MPGDSNNLENLLERVVQMNTVIIDEMQQQRKQTDDHLQMNLVLVDEIQQQRQQTQEQFRQLSTIFAETATPSSHLSNKIHVRPKDFNGTADENIITWLTSLDEIMTGRVRTDDERISLAVSLLGGTALQWFVNLSLKNQRPSSWKSFKDALIDHFQPPDFQENLRQQLLSLRQKQSLADYVAAFRNIIGQVTEMDELTQVMFFYQRTCWNY